MTDTLAPVAKEMMGAPLLSDSCSRVLEGCSKDFRRAGNSACAAQGNRQTEIDFALRSPPHWLTQGKSGARQEKVKAKRDHFCILKIACL